MDSSHGSSLPQLAVLAYEEGDHDGLTLSVKLLSWRPDTVERNFGVRNLFAAIISAKSLLRCCGFVCFFRVLSKSVLTSENRHLLQDSVSTLSKALKQVEVSLCFSSGHRAYLYQFCFVIVSYHEKDWCWCQKIGGWLILSKSFILFLWHYVHSLQFHVTLISSGQLLFVHQWHAPLLGELAEYQCRCQQCHRRHQNKAQSSAAHWDVKPTGYRLTLM